MTDAALAMTVVALAMTVVVARYDGRWWLAMTVVVCMRKMLVLI
jgi:hypothetical protein